MEFALNDFPIRNQNRNDKYSHQISKAEKKIVLKSCDIFQE